MPTQLGEYVLGRQLGAGGMGRVFEATDGHGRRVALKLLHPILALDAAVVAHVDQEARLLQQVAHPNVVRVTDAGVIDGTAYLVMRFVAGEPLGSLIQIGGPLSMGRVRKIATQLLEGLAAIHAAGLVHGDLKSDNILVDHRDHATIIDFDLVRAQETLPDWLGADILSGTPEYMAPELVKSGIATRSADIYAAGTIIYEMLTATTPFGGGTSDEIFERQVSDVAVAPSLRYPERPVPAPLEEVVMRALAKDPERRHHDASLFACAVGHAIPRRWHEDSLASWSTFSTTASTRRWSRRA